MMQATNRVGAHKGTDHICRSNVSKEILILLHPFNSPFSRTTLESRYQKGKTSLDLNEAREITGFWDAMASGGPYANNLYLTPDR